jgi:multiple sugar transport system permease protein
LIPAVSFIFPTFILFKAINWVDTYQALILLYAVAALPFTVWMIRGYIVEIPHEMEESALVDGCSRLGVLWRITLPLAAPGVAATAIFVFVWGWTEFLYAVILARTEAVTLPVVISSFYGTQAVHGWRRVRAGVAGHAAGVRAGVVHATPPGARADPGRRERLILHACEPDEGKARTW